MLQQQLILQMKLKPHSPINVPETSIEAWDRRDSLDRESSLDDILSRGKQDHYEKMITMEAFLLNRWKYGSSFERYLDSPLVAHCFTAMALKEKVDAVIGIKEAGLPYADIFRLMGLPSYEINFSHYKRFISSPEIDEYSKRELRGKNVLLTDIDFVTGKTITDVTKFLEEHKINVKGVYIGLSEWVGLKDKSFYVGGSALDFSTFWRHCGRYRTLRKPSLLYKKGIIPNGLPLYTSDGRLEKYPDMGRTASRKIAKYFMGKSYE